MKHTLWDMVGAEKKSLFQQKEIYNDFLELLTAGDDQGKQWSKLWERRQKNKSLWTVGDKLKIYLPPLLTVVAMVIVGMYTNLMASFFVGCFCFAPLVTLYIIMFFGMVMSRSIVDSMYKIKQNVNLVDAEYLEMKNGIRQ